MNNKNIGYYQKDTTQDIDGSTMTYFTVVLASYWDKNNHLDDSGGHEKHMPSGFYQLDEATYEHEYPSDQDAIKALENAGFVAKVLFP